MSEKSRRQFLATTLAAFPGAFLGFPRASVPFRDATALRRSAAIEAIEGQSRKDLEIGGAPISIRQLIDSILADIPGTPFANTVDTVKTGDPDQPVKGIVTTMFPTDAVIEKAAALGANFIIAHEPTFYNHLDQTEWLADDQVYGFKKGLLTRHGMVVWRFHDAWHAHRPDGILMGVLTAMGWTKYYDADDPHIIRMPGETLGNIIELAKKQLGIEKLKMIGDLPQICKRIALLPGASGGMAQIGMLQKHNPDLLICGEINEWETSEYVRDARYQGLKISLVILGHSVSEEPGMEWLIPWLQPKVPGIQITHLRSGDALRSV
jgi:putative NIF3 family GTP cyclohydrolase 1 type 2